MTRLHNPKTLAACCLLAVLCGACRQQVAFHAYRSLPADGWARTDTVSFEAVLPDTVPAFLLSVELRHRTSYPYRSLPVQVTLEVRGRLPVCDTVCLPVADSLGNWYGSGWGDLRTVASPSLSLPAGLGDTCRVSLVSLLPDSLLPGVNDMGILLWVDTGEASDSSSL